MLSLNKQPSLTWTALHSQAYSGLFSHKTAETAGNGFMERFHVVASLLDPWNKYLRQLQYQHLHGKSYLEKESLQSTYICILYGFGCSNKCIFASQWMAYKCNCTFLQLDRLTIGGRTYIGDALNLERIDQVMGRVESVGEDRSEETESYVRLDLGEAEDLGETEPEGTIETES